MVRSGRVLAGDVAAQVAGDAAVLVQDLDHRGRQAHVDLGPDYVELARRPGKRCLGPWGRSVNGGRPPGSAGQRTGAFGIQCLDGRTAPGFEMDG